MATDEQLIEQIQKGESEVYGELFRRYYQQINFICLSVLKNTHDAEEVTQETFIHAYLKLDQLRSPDKFFAWLKKIAQNRSKNYVRQTGPEIISFDLASAQTAREEAWVGGYPVQSGVIPLTQITPDEHLLKQELRDSIMEAVEALPPKDREVVRAHIDGLNHAEISARFGISVEASMSRLYRARKKIAAQVKDLLNAIIGLPKMLPVKKIISGGILAMKIGTSAKVTIGVIGVLVAGFIGFQVVIHRKTQQIEVKPPKRVTQHQMARPIPQPKSVRQRSDDDEQDVGQLEEALAWFDSLDEEYSTEPEEDEVTDSPLPNSEEDEITVKIQELEAQYANYHQQWQVLYEQRVEVTELREAHDGWEGMLKSKAQMGEVYRQIEKLGKDDEAERKVLQERIKQIMNEFNAEARALGDMARMLHQEGEALAVQMNAIKSELAYLKDLREEKASSDGR